MVQTGRLIEPSFLNRKKIETRWQDPLARIGAKAILTEAHLDPIFSC